MSKSLDIRRPTRRRFLKSAAGLGAAAIAAPYLMPASALSADGNVAANDRINVGMIAPEIRVPAIWARFLATTECRWSPFAT